ncbi:MAG: CpaD family pilus assembly protein [Hyphomonadaceae bacterium]|nr:CpaD family pilus assembly protein [Hyphomonadaceae bacterium]
MAQTPARLMFSGLALALLGACASERVTPPNVQMTALPTDRNPIGVQKASEVLEVAIDPAYPQLRLEDIHAMERFVAAYRDRGHGDLVMIMPENGPYQDMAVEVVKELRNIAWQNGVAWEQIQGGTFDARGINAPVLMSFEVYEAVAPDCLSLAAYDMSDISSNNEPSYFGCAVRNNLAAMLADPGDLLSQREIDPRDARRVSLIMEAYRRGGVTSATGNGEAVSASE